MKISIFKLIIIVFSVCSLFLFGCADDEYYGDYISNITFTDAGGENITLDMYRGVCDSGDPEPYTDVVANMQITVADETSGLTLNGYTIEYLAEESEDGTNTLVMPPTLNTLDDRGSETVYMPAGGTTEFTLTCFSVDQKEAYASLMTGAAYANLFISRYTIQYTLYCTGDDGESKNIVVQKTVYFGNYDNC